MTRGLDDRVAVITGAARGQGRAHAVRLASEGVDIIAIDNCADIATMAYAGATSEDLDETVRLVEDLDRRALTYLADVRDLAALQQAVDDGVRQLGRLDIVVANAGVSNAVPLEQMSEQQWDETVDIDLGGVWKTCKVCVPHIEAGGRGGSVVLTSSGAGAKGFPGIGHYSAAKSGVLGLMRSLAHELGSRSIRVNAVLPTTVSTPMVHNDALYKKFAPHVENPTVDDFAAVLTSMHLLPVPWVEVEDIANAVAFLASDEARYITGVALPVDAGMLVG
ncbi:mycofactocin-coupled SDR family oxidoreductase [Jatrophihabitans fulvus]